ncbi:MAG: hypothetical protein AAF236_01160 [Verrucomicrobiota bacterium]
MSSTTLRCLPREEWDEAGMTWQIECGESDAIGGRFEFRLETKVESLASRGVDRKTKNYETEIRLQRSQRVTVPYSAVKAFPYRGKSINIELTASLRGKDRGVKIKESTTLREPIFAIREGIEDAAELIEPKDLFSFKKNFKALPVHNKVAVIVLSIIGTIAVLIASALGIHDQFASEELLLSRVGSDGDAQSPLLAGLAGGGTVGVFFWFLIRTQLRKYMHLESKPLRAGIVPGLVCRAGDLFVGKSKVDLHDVILRVVACNQECGQRIQGSGTKQRTVSYRNPVNGLLLYECKVPLIKRGDAVERWFPGEVYFDTIFDALYPPMKVSGSHGLDLYWEIQLIHEDFVDQELVGSVGSMHLKDFLEREVVTDALS